MGVVTVGFTPDSRGSAYLFSTQLTVARKVNFVGQALMISNVGDGTANDRVHPIVFEPGAYCEKLELDCGNGVGTKHGNNNYGVGSPIQNHSEIGSLSVWFVGNNNNGALTPPEQIGVLLEGIDYTIDFIFVKGGRICVDVNFSDGVVGKIDAIGGVLGVRIGLGPGVGNFPGAFSINQIFVDSIVSVGVEVLSGADIHIGGITSIFSNGYVLRLGEGAAATAVLGLTVDNLQARNNPVTALKLSYSDGVRINMNLSNALLPWEVASPTPVVQAVEYGSGNSGAVVINVNKPTAVVLYTGTPYGALQVTEG
jgi:hypothetical protein